MFGGQHRDDEVTRTELVGWTRTTIGELRRSAPPEKTAGLRRCEGVCERNKNKSQKLLTGPNRKCDTPPVSLTSNSPDRTAKPNSASALLEIRMLGQGT
jgi:hypothetical protein